MGLSPKSNYEKKKIILVLTSGKFLEAREVELELALFSAFIFTFELGGDKSIFFIIKPPFDIELFQDL